MHLCTLSHTTYCSPFFSLPLYILVHLMQAANFITFMDLTPEARILWASSGVYDILGYEPDELVGMHGYNIVFPEDHSEGEKYHKEFFFS